MKLILFVIVLIYLIKVESFNLVFTSLIENVKECLRKEHRLEGVISIIFIVFVLDQKYQV
jgi:hypothetical protein